MKYFEFDTNMNNEQKNGIPNITRKKNNDITKKRRRRRK